MQVYKYSIHDFPKTKILRYDCQISKILKQLDDFYENGKNTSFFDVN